MACGGWLTLVGGIVFHFFTGFLLGDSRVSGPACLHKRLNDDLQAQVLQVSRNETLWRPFPPENVLSGISYYGMF